MVDDEPSQDTNNTCFKNNKIITFVFERTDFPPTIRFRIKFSSAFSSSNPIDLPERFRHWHQWYKTGRFVAFVRRMIFEMPANKSLINWLICQKNWTRKKKKPIRTWAPNDWHGGTNKLLIVSGSGRKHNYTSVDHRPIIGKMSTGRNESNESSSNLMAIIFPLARNSIGERPFWESGRFPFDNQANWLCRERKSMTANSSGCFNEISAQEIANYYWDYEIDQWLRSQRAFMGAITLLLNGQFSSRQTDRT